ncbi:hypothetical protein GKZ89_12620 [Bacillus mangrovi]|uniref:Addiction module toxin RelE n=1 Tax=Metabacillus mangrovi TaxID=1491830 RepID=A0A7X2S6D3_9BACI|nr:hypothetical protein [Metabacillus mangrovi]
MVLLHTFRKQTQKTPQREIDRAEKEMANWLINGKRRMQGTT